MTDILISDIPVTDNPIDGKVVADITLSNISVSDSDVTADSAIDIREIASGQVTNLSGSGVSLTGAGGGGGGYTMSISATYQGEGYGFELNGSGGNVTAPVTAVFKYNDVNTIMFVGDSTSPIEFTVELPQISDSISFTIFGTVNSTSGSITYDSDTYEAVVTGDCSISITGDYEL